MATLSGGYKWRNGVGRFDLRRFIGPRSGAAKEASAKLAGGICCLRSLLSGYKSNSVNWLGKGVLESGSLEAVTA
jgi:hypothetical protein